MTCEDARNCIQDLVTGELASEHHDELMDHLESCERCRTMYEQTSRMRSLLRGVLRSPAPPELRTAVTGLLAGI